ncbi:MAG: efflux RND transporter periplasmic adaptor subunit [Bacteroidetes bacterium]|nr:efflux RND transporter periplasmic adaptor subunit [Bacteroidota bacterium]
MNAQVFQSFVCFGLLSLLAACGQKTAPETGEVSSQIAVEQKIFAEAGMDTVRLADTVFSDYLRCSGQVDVDPSGRVLISSLTGGVVSSFDVPEGQQVRKGSVLFYIESTEIADLQYDYLESQAQLQLLDTQLARARRLAQGDATSQRELQQAETAYATAKARHDALQLKMDLLKLKPATEGIAAKLAFRAPFDGIVAKRMAINGQHMAAEQAIVELIDDSRKTLQLQVIGSQRAQIEIGQKVLLTEAVGQMPDIEAEIRHISPVADPTTSAVGLIATFTKGDLRKLPVGAPVQAAILTRSRPVKYLPSTAIVPHEGKRFVLVLDKVADEMMYFSPVEVTTGQTMGALTEVLSAEKLPPKPVIGKGGFQLLQ